MTKKGEYQATVSVEDSSKNKAEKTFTIKVVAELKENEKKIIIHQLQLMVEVQANQQAIIIH